MLYRVQHPARYASRLQTILSLDVELIDTHFGRPSTAATDGPRENPRRPTDTSANRLRRRLLQGSIGRRQRRNATGPSMFGKPHCLEPSDSRDPFEYILAT